MNKNRNFIWLLILIFGLIQPFTASAQQYNVSYNDKSIVDVITDLTEKTGYEFVYQKQIIKDIDPITCKYDNLNLNQLLDYILIDKAGLNYELIDKNIILSKLKKTIKILRS
jgi:hypothetical protein